MRSDHILVRLTVTDLKKLRMSAEAAQRVENHYGQKITKAFDKSVDKVLDSLESGKTPDLGWISDLLIENFFQASFDGFRIAEKESELERRVTKRLAKSKTFPRGLNEMRKLYDAWRKGKWVPKWIQKSADRVRKEYLKKTRSIWDRYGEDFRTGGQDTRAEVAERIREAAGTSSSRAKVIVRTETTNAYNEAKKAFYDSSPEVTHYLFLAIRDQRTTKWCSSLTTNGKRGRHGLVYAKDDELTNKERPACHYNCRSEFLPLTPYNPSHKRMIEDPSIQRRNVRCHPLLPGWTSTR